jgi:succinyl-diaminopimelate desuccinylase
LVNRTIVEGLLEMSIEGILSKVEDLSDEVVEVCSQLIQRPSDHPEGRTDGCVEYIKGYFDGLGVESQIYQRDEGKPNIVVRVKGASGRKILWVGHNDVVPVGAPEGWKHPPFSGKVEDGKVYGRGASDMKGSNASAMIAARVLSEVGCPHDVDFWFTADEEVGGGAGARWLADEKIFEGEVAIIGDASGCDPGLVNVGVGHKGGIGSRLVAEGRTAHGSTPYLGDNAIDKLLKVIPYVKRLSEFRLDIPDDLEPILESTTEYMLKDESLDEEQRKAVERLFYYPSGPSLNIFNGGFKGNVVPDSAQCRFDIRLTPGVDAVKVKERLEALVAEADVPGVTLIARVSPRVGYYERADEPSVVSLVEAVERVTGERPPLTLMPWGTDAMSIKRNIRTEEHPEGIPNLLFGPMLRDQLHQSNEYVTTRNLVTAAKVYSLFPFYYK